MTSKTEKYQDIAKPLLQSVYWYLTPFSERNYIKYWLFVGTVSLFLFKITLYAFGESISLWTLIFFSYFVICGGPMATLFASNVFLKLVNNLFIIFKSEDNFLSDWVTQEIRKIFNVRYFPMWFFALSINIIATITLLMAGLPFKSVSANILSLIFIQPFFFICGHSAYILMEVGLFHYRLARLPLSVPFPDYCHRIVYDLINFSYSLSFFVLVEYLGLFFAVRLSPYRDSNFMTPWLIILALTPIVFFSWNVFQIHILQREIKLQHIGSITSEVRKLFGEFTVNPTLENTDRLFKAIEIQQRIEQAKEWPTPPQIIITLIFTAIAATNQILAVIHIFKS